MKRSGAMVSWEASFLRNAGKNMSVYCTMALSYQLMQQNTAEKDKEPYPFTYVARHRGSRARISLSSCGACGVRVCSSRRKSRTILTDRAQSAQDLHWVFLTVPASVAVIPRVPRIPRDEWVEWTDCFRHQCLPPNTPTLPTIKPSNAHATQLQTPPARIYHRQLLIFNILLGIDTSFASRNTRPQTVSKNRCSPPVPSSDNQHETSRIPGCHARCTSRSHGR